MNTKRIAIFVFIMVIMAVQCVFAAELPEEGTFGGETVPVPVAETEEAASEPATEPVANPTEPEAEPAKPETEPAEPVQEASEEIPQFSIEEIEAAPETILIGEEGTVDEEWTDVEESQKNEPAPAQSKFDKVGQRLNGKSEIVINDFHFSEGDIDGLRDYLASHGYDLDKVAIAVEDGQIYSIIFDYEEDTAEKAAEEKAEKAEEAAEAAEVETAEVNGTVELSDSTAVLSEAPTSEAPVQEPAKTPLGDDVLVYLTMGIAAITRFLV